MNFTNKSIILKQRPLGKVSANCFEYQESSVRDLIEGEILVSNAYVSLDPAIRGWMNEGTTYIKGSPIGEPMRAFAIGEVVLSKNKNFEVGQIVQGLLGVQTLAISNGQGLSKCDISQSSISAHLGVLGMPGMTAYFGLLERGQPKPNETVFISGAAGVVGATAGQIAKIKGCRVVGSAGGKEKCDYLLSIGFDEVIDYKSEDLVSAIKEKIPEGISVFYDNVGGETLDAGLANLAIGARVVICGAISQYNESSIQGPKNYMKIVTARGNMTGIIVFDFLERYPEAVSQISEWLLEGKLKHKEHIVEGIHNFYKALTMLFEGKNFGKLLLKL